MEPVLRTELSYLGHLNHWMCRSLACCFTPKNLGNLGSNPSALCRCLANLTCIAGHLLLATSGRFGLRNHKTQCLRCKTAKQNDESITKVESGQAKPVHATSAPGCLRTISKPNSRFADPEPKGPKHLQYDSAAHGMASGRLHPLPGPCPLNRQLTKTP